MQECTQVNDLISVVSALKIFQPLATGMIIKDATQIQSLTTVINVA
jgi:hypothetical protein